MIAGEILKLRGVFNATTNFILDEMAAGAAYGDALAEAQRRGIAEADPSLDVEGWDTANKLLIIANSLLGADLALADIAVTGIAEVTAERIAAEAALGNVIRLVASAEAGRYAVAPVALPAADFLAQCRGWEMAVEMHTDIPTSTASARTSSGSASPRPRPRRCCATRCIFSRPKPLVAMLRDAP